MVNYYFVDEAGDLNLFDKKGRAAECGRSLEYIYGWRRAFE